MIIAAKMSLTPLSGSPLFSTNTPSFLHWNGPPGRESASCFLPAGSEHKMNYELHMPSQRGHGPYAAPKWLPFRSNQIKSTDIFLFRIKCYVNNLFNNKRNLGFFSVPVLWRETLLVNIQSKNANARKDSGSAA